jgi:hypothetical protein
MLLTLCTYQEKNGDVEGIIDSLNKVRTIYNYLDLKKEVAGIKARLAEVYTRIDKLTLALN